VLSGRARGLEPYEDRLSSALRSYLAVAWVAKAALERAPALAFAVAGSGPAGRLLCRRVREGSADVGEHEASPRAQRIERFARALLGPQARSPGVPSPAPRSRAASPGRLGTPN
jgi:hypothetical protein